MVKSTKNLGGAPDGNENAAKGALFHSALKRALARSNKSVDGGLNSVCDKLVKAAVAGEQWAIKEVADRIDGKATQLVNVGGQAENPLQVETVLRPQETKEEYLARKGL